MGATTKISTPFILNALVEPAFSLGSFVIGGDIGFSFASETKTTVTIPGMGSTTTSAGGGLGMGIGAWVGLNFSNGLFKAGVATRLPVDDNTLIFSIPLVLEYFF
ncbi:MAG: hypothetical protein LBH57_09835 [Treponema sp.]|nr:hypothetical protein [Treponema sp.]